MAGLFPKLTAIFGALALSACVAGGGNSGKAAGPNPVTGTEIEVTALDAPAIKPGAKPAAVTPAEKPATAPTAPQAPASDAPKPEASAEAAAPEAVALPVVEKTPAQLACEKRGNSWMKAGQTGAFACVTRLTDGGKRCTSGSQCQGDCLARSNTCAPITPLFGCNDILQDNGGQVTLCLD